MYFNPHNDCLSFSENQKMMPLHFGTQDNIDSKGHVGNVFAYDSRLHKRVQMHHGDLAVIFIDAFEGKDGKAYNRYFVPTPRQREVYKAMKAKAKAFTKKTAGF